MDRRGLVGEEADLNRRWGTLDADSSSRPFDMRKQSFVCLQLLANARRPNRAAKLSYPRTL
jgi:hypothetical protein